ncbi:MAG: nucleotide sugar dehydrogenase [Anaerolineae bacterium]|nr:nucleotide sugar dehydrogenase [Anaerolineae bacterium]NIN95988.1 nucleotide sugar dehydrogenase [Anaerolineae bacterium]NIQ79020.1 nucleotide sugar dehydrogenase [Anaerolineae bacterium]
MSKICVIGGGGYVGLATGACFADLGNDVVCVDIDEAKIEGLKRGKLPIYEPGLQEMVERNAKMERLRFTTSYSEGLEGAEFAFIAVDTPSGSEGEADLKYVHMAAETIAKEMSDSLIIVNKSTVPIGTGDWVAEIVEQHVGPGLEFAVVSNPEFLREGAAINDFLHPDRIVLGSTDPQAAQKVAQLYLSLRAPIIVTDLRTAEMIKYASNAYLANRISFINEIASICEQLGADVKEVAAGMGYDKRIGHFYLDAGVGWGGSCFPKDVKALAHMAAIHGCHPQLLRAVIEINRDQRRRIVQNLRETLGTLHGKTVGILGLAFKPNTDDMREAPAVEIIHLLQHEGASIKAFDPVATPRAKEILPEVEYCEDAYEVAEGSDALVIVTDWNEFKHLDMARIRASMAQPVLMDGRNIYEPRRMEQLGFIYRGIGRGYEKAEVTTIANMPTGGQPLELQESDEAEA